MMDDNDNQVIIPDFQEDLPVEENQEERFIVAMIQARGDRAPIQVFQDLLNNAPPVSVADLSLNCEILETYNCCYSNMSQRLHDYEGPYGLLLHQVITKIYDASVETIELVLDAFPEGLFEKDRNSFLPF
jgi:hypothetical protein